MIANVLGSERSVVWYLEACSVDLSVHVDAAESRMATSIGMMMSMGEHAHSGKSRDQKCNVWKFGEIFGRTDDLL